MIDDSSQPSIAELNQRNRQLHSEIWRYQALAESVFGLYCECDTKGVIHYLSPNYFKVLGWDIQEVLGKKIFEFIHLDDIELSINSLKAAVETGSAQATVRIYDHAGNWHWFEVSGRSYQNDTGEIRVLALAYDITKRKQVEEELYKIQNELEARVQERTSELADVIRQLELEVDKHKNTAEKLRTSDQRWQSLVENAPQTILLFDKDCKIKFINHLTKFYAQDQVIDVPAYELVIAEHQEIIQSAIQSVFNTEKPTYYECQDILEKNWYLTHLAPIIIENKVDAVVGICSDITAEKHRNQEIAKAHDELERRVAQRTAELAEAIARMERDLQTRIRVEQELRESEQRCRVIVDSMPIAVVISRFSDGMVIHANKLMEKMFETTLEELKNKPTPNYFYNPDDRKRVLEGLQLDGKIRTCEVKLVNPKGKYFWTRVSLKVIEYQGEAVVLAGHWTITDRIEAEQELQQEQRLLTRLILRHERNRKLLAYELHDGLVQELTGALMHLEAANAGLESEESTEKKNIQQAVHLLRNALNEGRRLINGLRPPILDEGGLIAALEHLMQDIREMGELQVDCKYNVQFDRIDPDLENSIYRIIQEALSNVRKHSKCNKASVEMIQKDDRVYITIADLGIGFDPEETSLKQFGLTGIKERARLLGGETKIESVIGQGTIIKVNLPLTNQVPEDFNDDDVTLILDIPSPTDSD